MCEIFTRQINACGVDKGEELEVEVGIFSLRCGSDTCRRKGGEQWLRVAA